MKPSLQFRLSQHLTLTPQLQQSIRLLQLSTVELNQEIDRILMENPALEREDIEGGDAPAAPAPAGGSGADSNTTAAEAPPAPDAEWPGDLAPRWAPGGGGGAAERFVDRPPPPAPLRARRRRRALPRRMPRAPAPQHARRAGTAA